jgi:hypothetical protein
MDRAAASVAMRVLGRIIVVETAPAALRHLLVRHWYRPEFDPGSVGASIWVRHVPARRLPACLRAALPAVAGPAADRRAPSFQRHEETVSIVAMGGLNAGALLRIRPLRTRVLAWGEMRAGAPGGEILVTALHDALRASDLVPLHCAAAVAPGESEATVFLGASGIGKTTTLVHVAKAGWDVVCEDLAWFDPAPGALYGWDRALHALPDTLRALEPVESYAQKGEPKRSVAFDAFAQRCGVKHRPSAGLQRVVVLRRDDGPSRWGPLSRRDAVASLWESIGMPLAAWTRPVVAKQIASLVSGHELATLYLGSTPLPIAPTEMAQFRP